VFEKILVANRGEIASRVIRTCREMGIRTASVYSDADRWARFVSAADEAHPLGAPAVRESYLNAGKILDIARRIGADALHPGYGFLSENADFARACRKAGIVFIGPSPESIERVGNKLAARRLAKRARVPVVPGTDEPLDGPPASSLVRRIGFPLLIKAAAGGGGRGMRVVRAPSDFDRAFREARHEAANAFGDGTLFLERYLENPKHVEVQIFGDSRGNVLHLFERECSVQRRHQKLIEESPSPSLSPAQRRRLLAAAVKIGRAAGYRNAGTCEFLVDAKGRFFFLEVNSRLQVEHPVTEAVTGLDLVRLQILVAAGRPLPFRQKDVVARGHAIECRILAEDPHGGFAPSIGEIPSYRLPGGPFVRIDSDLTPGMQVTLHYDSLIAKLIGWGPTRQEAIDRVLRALQEFKIAGIETTIPFHRAMLQDPAFRRGRVHTRYVETEFSMPVEERDARLAALLAAGLEYLKRERTAPRTYSPRPLPAWKRALRRGPIR
jgi:acetyl-CoA carboxylase biotin carboxylase subunit